MIILNGKYNSAKVFTDNIDQSAISQIIELLNQPMSQNQLIRIMPDVHAGKGCTIGTTMTITDKVVPNLVGVDIGCGMETVKLKEKSLDFDTLDKLIREKIPSGFDVRAKPHALDKKFDIRELRCYEHGADIAISGHRSAWEPSEAEITSSRSTKTTRVIFISLSIQAHVIWALKLQHTTRTAPMKN